MASAARCAARAARGLRRLRPATAVYVPCNPEALASDLDRICRTGYEVTSIQPVDMFPQSAHIETVVTFRCADTC